MNRLKPKDIVFVGLQILLFALFFLLPSKKEWHFPFWVEMFFFIVAILGLVIAVLAILQLRRNLSPFPTPVSEGKLIQTGLYKKVRHPVYSGLLLFFFGYALWQVSLFKFFVALLLLLLFYFKSRYEEKLLIAKFSKYKGYQQRSGRFFPFR